MDGQTISISALILIGTLTIAFSMLAAKIIISIRDARAKPVATHEDEGECLLEDDELLPPYEHAPPAYVAELDAGVDENASKGAESMLQSMSGKL